MGIKLSRHARNNMRLYGILEAEISESIQNPDHREKEGEKIVVLRSFRRRFYGFPLKVVCRKEGNEFFIITAYPLKKSYRRKI
ncbi:MAG: DUF4258 domain-containing protein [Deltaproteobacteria bacterium]|nr:DUF4258 domain-containing protein [Deltaproteobacteria bacterium]